MSMKPAPQIGQLGLMSPARESRRIYYAGEDVVTAINTEKETTLIESDPRDVDFHSQVRIRFGVRTGVTGAIASGANDVLVVEAYRIVAGVTSAFVFPIDYRPVFATAGLIQTFTQVCDTRDFIHQPGVPVTYGVRARIEDLTALSVNCRKFWIEVEWIPVIATR